MVLEELDRAVHLSLRDLEESGDLGRCHALASALENAGHEWMLFDASPESLELHPRMVATLLPLRMLKDGVLRRRRMVGANLSVEALAGRVLVFGRGTGDAVHKLALEHEEKVRKKRRVLGIPA